jgi:hypothetical protein
MRVVEMRANMMNQSFLVMLSDLKRYSGMGFYTAHMERVNVRDDTKYFNISNVLANDPMMDTCNREVSKVGSSCWQLRIGHCGEDQIAH